MKQLVILVLAALVSCTSSQTAGENENNNINDKQDKVEVVPLNKGTKWKADESTKNNVAAMLQLINDSSYADAEKRKQLYTNLKTKVDTMVKECSMDGAAHDALHVWLKKLLKDVKELKDEDDDYSEAYTAVKNDLTNFYQSFD